MTQRAVDRARRGEGASLVELMTYRRKGHAEHDNQSYVPAGEIERWETRNDPLDRYVAESAEFGWSTEDELRAIDDAGRGTKSTRLHRSGASGSRALSDAVCVRSTPTPRKPLVVAKDSAQPEAR